MKTIYKYPIPLSVGSSIRMPVDARIIRAEMDETLVGTKVNRTINLWALVDTDYPMEPCNFYVYGTGQPIDEGHVYVATVKDRSFYWHIFQGDVQ